MAEVILANSEALAKIKWLKTPHLPTEKVSVMAISEMETELISRLENEYKIAVLQVRPHPMLPSPIASHSDINLFDCGNGSILVLKDSPKETVDNLLEIGANIEFSSGTPAKQYPDDALLDAALFGDSCFLNSKSADEKILSFCEANGKEIINVKQGYTKCSMLLLPNRSIITSDRGIALKARKKQFNVLEIEEGYVELKGYSCGMFGGCCGMLSSDCVAFAGDLHTHPSCDSIIAFCRDLHIFTEPLDSGNLRDVGGFLPLAEVDKQ